MMLPKDVDHEVYRLQRQAEAVAIYLEQHRGDTRVQTHLQHKIQAIKIYISELESHRDK